MGKNTNINRSIILDGCRVFIRNLRLQRPMEFDMKQDFPFMKLHFVLEGKIHYEPNSDEGLPITVNDTQYNFFYLPEVDGKLLVCSGNVSTIDIEFDEEFIKRLLKSDFYKIAGTFVQAIQYKIPFKMWDEAKKIDLFLNSKVDEILLDSQKHEIDIIKLETLLNTLFRYLLLKMDTKGHKLPPILKKEERAQVEQAEKILRQHLKEPITIEELARSLGTNRHKLNRNFKKVFNEPIFSYLTRLRMHKARALLIKKEMNISEVSYSVGYKNSQHFTVAFKKFFGYLPSKLLSKQS